MMADFSTFWTMYPRKVGKRAARAEWDKTNAKPEEIIQGLRSAITTWKVEETELKYLPHASTWLHQGRWEDGVSVDVVALQKKNYRDFTDGEWRFFISTEDNLEYAKQFMPAHIKKEFGFGLEIVKNG